MDIADVDNLNKAAGTDALYLKIKLDLLKERKQFVPKQTLTGEL